jgi:hypothetical protein
MTCNYSSCDLGELVNETNQAVNTYQLATKIPLREDGWQTFSFDLTLTNSKFRINARASEDTAAYTNVMQALLGVDEITASGVYEVTHPCSFKDLEIEWETTNATNATIVTFSVSKLSEV